MHQKSDIKNRIIFFTKLFIGLGFLTFILIRFDISSIDFNIFYSSPYYLILGIILLLFSFLILENIRLKLLLDIEDFTLIELIKLSIISMFFNSFLPSNIGGDGYKVIYIQKKMNSNLNKPFTIVFLTRFAGLVVFLLIGIIFYFINSNRIHNILNEQNLTIEMNYWIVIISIFSLFIVLLILFFVFPSFFRKYYLKVISFYKNSLSVFNEISKYKYLLLILITFLMHTLRVLGFYYLVLYLNDTILWYDIYFVLFITTYISVIPISIGGLGVQEGAIAMSMNFFGVSEDKAIIIALLNRILILVITIIGAFFYYYSDYKRIKDYNK